MKNVCESLKSKELFSIRQIPTRDGWNEKKNQIKSTKEKYMDESMFLFFFNFFVVS